MKPSPTNPSDELREKLKDLKRPEKTDLDVIEAKTDDLLALIAQHTKEAVLKASIHEVQEVRRWIRASGMAPDFEKRLTAVAGYLDRRLTELSAPQQSTSPDEGSAE